MNNIINVGTFKFLDKELIAFLNEDETVWFVANQVLDILGYDMSHTARTLKRNARKNGVKRLNRQDLVSLFNNEASRHKGRMASNDEIIEKIWTSGANDTKEKAFINEPSLYALVMHSRKKEAEEFQDWVYNDVIMSIRKTGKYEMTEDNANPLMVQLQESTELLNTERERNKELQTQLDKVTREKDELQKEAIRNSTNGFYSEKIYSANYNVIETFTTKMVADRLDVKWNVLDQILSERNFHFFNPDYTVLRTNFNNMRYNINPQLFNEGCAVWMPYTEQDKYPNWYYQRWTRQGLDMIRDVVEFEKANNPQRFNNLTILNNVINNSPFPH